MGFDTAIVDVDGTLVDSNYHHTRAWQRAFDEVGLRVPAWRIHRAIGMGGEKLVAFVTSDVVERAHGDRIRERWEIEVDAVLHEIQAFEGAAAFLDDLRQRGLKVVLASSGKAEHTERALEVLDARGRVDHVITSQDVDATKPEPDLLVAALDAAGGSSALVFGDTVWDALAAQRADLPMVGLLTGGFGRAELVDAGARHVYDDVRELVDDLGRALDLTKAHI